MSSNCNVAAWMRALVWIICIPVIVGGFSNNLLTDDQLQKLIRNQIDLFRGHAGKRDNGTDRKQFAVLTLFSTTQKSGGRIFRPDSVVPAIRPYIYTYKGNKCMPTDELIKPNKQQIYPYVDNAVNFIVAAVKGEGDEAIHSEQAILSTYIDRMYTHYKKCFKEKPQYVVLYSWFIPCEGKCNVRKGCRYRIVDTFNSPPFNQIPNRILAYTDSQEFGATTKTKSPNRSKTTKSSNKRNDEHPCVTLLKQNNIKVIGPIKPNSPFRGNRELTLIQSEVGSQSFQECLLGCYGSMLGACATDKQGAGKLFIDQLMFQIEDSIQDDVLKAQFKAIKWIRESVGRNCKAHTNLTQQTRSCISQCRSTGSLFFIGEPFTGSLDDNSSAVFPTKIYNKNPDASGWSRICGGSTGGVLCSKFEINSVTVGVKNTITVRGEQCRDDFPCSTHGRNYHWCYTADGGKWNYCCNPHYACHHDENHKYDWCYTGKKDRERRMYCKVV